MTIKKGVAKLNNDGGETSISIEPTVVTEPMEVTHFPKEYFTQKEMFEMRRKFAQKKLNVMKEVERVPKNGWNAFHKYAYTTESDLSESIRPLLFENNLAFDCEVIDSVKGNNDLTEVTMVMTLTDVETGYTESKHFKAEGQDKGDKGYYKAYTGAVKYFLMKTFLIPTGDDPEGTEDTQYQSNQQQPKNNNQKKNNQSNQSNNNGSVLEIATPKQIGAINGKVAELVKLGKKQSDVLSILRNKCGEFEKIENIHKKTAISVIDYLNQWINNAKGNTQ